MLDDPGHGKLLDIEPTLPLINIVFLLLIFFMIAGSIANYEILQIEAAVTDYGKESVIDDEVVLMTGKGEFAYAGQIYSKDQLHPLLTAVIENEPVKLLIKADRNLNLSVLSRMIEGLKEHDINNVYLLTKR